VNSLGQIISCGDDKTVKLWHVESPMWEELVHDDDRGDDDDDDDDDEEAEDEDEEDFMQEDEDEDEDEDGDDDDDDESAVYRQHNKNKNRNRQKQKMTTKKQAKDQRRFAIPIHTSPIAHSGQSFADAISNNATTKPMQLWLGKAAFTAISHQYPHRPTSVFATTCTDSTVDVWSYERSEPIATMRWSSTSADDSLTSCAFNPIEHDIVAATSQSDRSVLFFDLRSNTAVRKLVLSMNSNVVAWNPMEAFNFTVGNEDHNCYTFDMRKLQTALNVHIDHVGAVLDVEYSPTGREFVSGSYDRTVRIFPVDKGRSREVYHTKRMQRVFCVKFTADAKYVISGSDDANIRLWKADAAKPLGIVRAPGHHHRQASSADCFLFFVFCFFFCPSCLAFEKYVLTPMMLVVVDTHYTSWCPGSATSWSTVRN
jgi:WD40 repeat protein